MSTVKINGLNIHYEKYGTKGKPVVLLHGWGQNTEMMAFIGEHLKNRFVVYNIDFPGFGQSDEQKEVWGADDYTEFLHDFCTNKKIKNPIIIAHSFGCRVAVRYAYKYGAYKMCLTGAAGLIGKRPVEYYIKVYSYKFAKKVLALLKLDDLKKKLEKNAGSQDYKNTSGVMRDTFIKVVNEDTKDILPEVECETLLVFGEKDEATPLALGKKMEELMPNAALVVFENDDHFAYINEAQRFNLVLDAFLNGD